MVPALAEHRQGPLRARAGCYQGASPCGHAQIAYSQVSDLPCNPVNSTEAGRVNVWRWEIVVFIIYPVGKAAQKIPASWCSAGAAMHGDLRKAA